MIKTILVGTPTSNGTTTAALTTAAELAISSGAELILLELDPVIDARRVFDPDGVPEATDRLRTLRTSYPGLRVRSHRAGGNPTHAMCRMAEQEGSDLIVLPRGRLGDADRVFSSRASSSLAELVECPVLLVAS